MKSFTVGLLIVLVSGLIGWLRKRWLRPRLHVWYEPRATKERRGVPGVRGFIPSGSVATTSTAVFVSTGLNKNPSPSQWCWYHVQVRNLGREPADSAKGYIVRLLEEDDDGKFKAHPDWGARLTLQWANTGFKEELRVENRTKKPWHRLDILQAGNVPGSFALVTPDPLVGLPTALSSGVYRVHVIVESQKTSAECTLEITLERGWDEVSVRQIPLDLVSESAGRT